MRGSVKRMCSGWATHGTPGSPASAVVDETEGVVFLHRPLEPAHHVRRSLRHSLPSFSRKESFNVSAAAQRSARNENCSAFWLAVDILCACVYNYVFTHARSSCATSPQVPCFSRSSHAEPGRQREDGAKETLRTARPPRMHWCTTPSDSPRKLSSKLTWSPRY